MSHPRPFGRQADQPVPAVAEAAAVAVCANCQAPLQGPFCHACGQPAKVRESVLDLARDLWARLIDVNRGSLVGLGRLVVAPGRMTADWLAGRRVRALAPWHALMLALSVYYLAPLVFNYEHRSGDMAERIARDAEQWRLSGLVMLGSMMPCHFAGLSALLAGREASAYRHLVTTIYQFAFILLLTPVAGLILARGDGGSIMLALYGFAAALFAHLIDHLRGAYGLSWFGAIWRTVVLMALNLAAFGTVTTFAALVFDTV